MLIIKSSMYLLKTWYWGEEVDKENNETIEIKIDDNINFPEIPIIPTPPPPPPTCENVETDIVIREIEGKWKSTEYKKCSGTFHIVLYKDNTANMQLSGEGIVTQNLLMDWDKNIVEDDSGEHTAEKWMLRNSTFSVNQQFIVTLTRDINSGEWYYGNYACLYPTDLGILSVDHSSEKTKTEESIEMQFDDVTFPEDLVNTQLGFLFP